MASVEADVQIFARKRSTPAWIRLLLIAQAVSAALYTLLVLGAVKPLDLSWWPVGVSCAITAVVCGARAARPSRERLAWLMLGAGFAGWAWGFLSWTAIFEGDSAPPYPSVSDAGWLLFLVLAVCALVLLARSERLSVPRRVWVDAVSAACAMSAILAQLLLPQIATGLDGVLAALTVLAYPLGDLVLVAVVVVVLTLRQWSAGPRWTLLGVAICLIAAADVAWSILVASGDFEPGGDVDVLWILASVLVSRAAWSPATQAAPRADGRLAIALPGFFSLAALALLVYGAVTGDLTVLSLALAVTAIGLGVVRWSLAVSREAQAGALRQVADELARRAAQQAAVADLGSRAIAGQVDELMARAADVADWILDSERAYVLELDPASGGLIVRAAAGSAAARSPGDAAGELLEAIVLAAGDGDGTALVTVLDETPEGSAAALSALGARAALVAPVARKEGRWGVLAVLTEEETFAEDDPSFLAAVSNVVGAVLSRARAEDLESQLQQSQRLESVGQLAGGVAHDFNNILAVILNYAEFAREAATDPQQQDDLAELSTAADRGAELVKQLLLFGRRRGVDAFPLDVSDAVRDTAPMLRRTIGEHIRLQCDLADDLPPVLIDPGRLAQVLVNLAVNGRDAMNGGGTLTIATERCSSGLLLSVEDTGAGMPEDVARKAFDPFFTTKPTGSGTGLGLATVYGIVTEAGGAVMIDSRVGYGTRVVIELPATASSAVRPPGAERPTLTAGNGETILLVEDDDQVRGVAERILNAGGYRVVGASGPERAIALAARGGAIDLLLTDVVMPEMSGVELSRHLRLLQPDLRVLYMSGYTSGVGVPETGHSLPDLIEKPFSAADLVARVQAMLREAERVPLS